MFTIFYCFSSARISEIEPKYYAMKRDLVGYAVMNDITPADPIAFFDSKNQDEKKKKEDMKKE